MADKRPFEFSVLLRFPGKESVKIMFFSAALWPDKGGRDGLYRLKIGTPVEGKAEFSEAWHPGPRKYEFLTPMAAWKLVAAMGGQEVCEPGELPEIPVGTPVRVPNGNVLAGEVQYDITRTATAPVRLIDGRGYLVVGLIGRGAVHVPLDAIEIMRRKP